MSSPLPVLPQVIVEAGFSPSAPVGAAGVFLLSSATQGILGTDTLGSANTWTDITTWFRNFTITRSSTRQQGPLYTYQASTAAILLDNSDGRFDPDNLTSPYFAGITQVRPMIPVRVSAVFAGVTYRLFTGFADAWTESPVTYEGGYSEVTVTASDGFKMLAGVTLAAQPSPVGAGDSTDGRINRVLTAVSWYTDHRTLQAGATAALQGTSYGASALSLMQLATDTEAGQLFIDGNGVVQFRSRRSLPQNATPQAYFGDLPGNPAGAQTITPSGTPGSLVTVGSGTSLTYTFAANPAAGATVWLAVQCNTAFTNLTVKDNGAVQSAFAQDAATPSASTPFGFIFRANNVTMPASGAYAVTITSSASPGTIEAYGIAATGVRAGAPTAVSQGSGTGTAVSTGSATPSAAGAQYIAAFFDHSSANPETITLTASGFSGVTETNGASLWAGGVASKLDSGGPTATACTWTLGDSVSWNAVIAVYDAAPAAGTEIAYASVSRANDDTQLANDIQNTAVGSANLQEAQDATSEATFLFPRTYARTDLPQTSDADALAWAQYILYLSKGGADRFDVLTIDPLADTANLYPQVLGREIGDRIQVWKTPPNVTRFSKDAFIAGITHTFDTTTLAWQTTWTLQDAAPYSKFLILGSATRGQLGINVLTY